jgi:hypothetical protein
MTTPSTPTAPTPSFEYEAHRLAKLLPPMTEGEYKALYEDIKANDLRTPIVRYQNTILDGWHRYRALKKLEEIGRRITEEHFTDLPASTDPLKFVISQNLHRRHLNESQRAVIAATVANLQKGANQYTKEDGSIDRSKAAAMFNVSEKSVQRAAEVVKKAAPQLVDQVWQGTLRVGKLTGKVLKKPHAEQIEVMKPKEATPKSVTPDTTKAWEAYETAEGKLIEKLKGLTLNQAEDAIEQTKKKLKETLTTLQAGAAKKAA